MHRFTIGLKKVFWLTDLILPELTIVICITLGLVSIQGWYMLGMLLFHL